MGYTKEKQFYQGLKLTRIITAVLTGLFSLIAFSQLIFFQNIKVSFLTGTDAQQIETIKIKKGSNVELPVPMKPGACFLGWSLSPNSDSVIENSTGLLQDTTLYAVWDGAEKYAVLSINGVPFKEVNIFDTSVEGLTSTELNGSDWRILDDFDEVIPNTNERNPDLVTYNENFPSYRRTINPNNNFSRFKGWRYLNANDTYNDLLFTHGTGGAADIWTWIQRDEYNNVISETIISDTNKFYPPNYRTTFTALLEYRTVNIQLYDKGEINLYRTYPVGEDEIVLPTFKYNSNKHFSHWELKAGYLKNYAAPEYAEAYNRVKTHYEAGEIINTLDPMWYYYGNDLLVPNQRSDLQVYLKFEAVYWEVDQDATDWEDDAVFHYSVQPFTNAESGTSYQNFGHIRRDDLSVENPVAYDPDLNCIWLYYTNEILSYEFYDHNGNHHILTTDRFGKANQSIAIGDDVSDKNIYFKDEWRINVRVNYQTSAINVTVKFNFGEDLYLLPNYNHKDAEEVSFASKIGNDFEILTCEKYMKKNYIFIGWQIEGDDSGRLYSAGERFTVPNYPSYQQSAEIKFVAVWHLQRLLFDFDFNGGSWNNEAGPDFTKMKGAYGKSVHIVNEEPVRFGYDFIGWTLENNTEIMRPGDLIKVGTRIQTLHAHWTPRRLKAILYVKDANGNDKEFRIITEDNHGQPLLSEGTNTIQLPPYANVLYIFHGWQIGGQAINSNTLTLSIPVLLQLDTALKKDSEGYFIEVPIYASLTKYSINVEYNVMIGLSNGSSIDLSEYVDVENFETSLTRGTRFSDYYPFNCDRTTFDTLGHPFVGWKYLDDVGTSIEINSETLVPENPEIKHITIYGSLDSTINKKFEIHYYDHEKNHIVKGEENKGYGDGNIRLLNYNDSAINIQPVVVDWGAFVGWALEPDTKVGNPKVIFDVFNYRENYNDDPWLKLSNQNNTRYGTQDSPYLVNIDRYAEHIDGLRHQLKLYAVYALDAVTISYGFFEDSNNPTSYRIETLDFPVYTNNYDKARYGGKTVGYDSEDFAEYGLSVLDDYGIIEEPGQNFIGWRVVPNSLTGVSDEIKNQFTNKIWFPGEYLPSIDFNFRFDPIFVLTSNQVQTVDVNGRKYSVLSLRTSDIVGKKANYNKAVDVVALPRGNYTIQQGGIVINSDREVHVVVPAKGNITLEPRAIQCNTIREFYVSDNLTITGSPVIGANFQFYRVQKGYRLKDSVDSTPTVVLNPNTKETYSPKYDFAASMSGLLVGTNHTLYGVPSHSIFTGEDVNHNLSLLNCLNHYSITRIASYALSDINNLTTLNLAKNTNLQIDELAIFGGTIQNIILPGTDEYDASLDVDAQVLAGALTELVSVTFGNTTATSSWYAFVDNGFIYYIDDLMQPNAKNHLTYALSWVAVRNLNSLDYINHNLTLDNEVITVEPYALAGLDWKRVNCITANHDSVNLKSLVVPDNVPLFISVNNYNHDTELINYPMIQPYRKIFRFTCAGYSPVDVSFVYGQPFRVFSAQNNQYFTFDHLWSLFDAWKYEGKLLHVGEIYQVGISDKINGNNKYLLTFDASEYSTCWLPYPVQFVTYNNYQPEGGFILSDDNRSYTMADLVYAKNKNTIDVSKIYLPGLDQEFNSGNDKYRFIGWTRLTLDSSVINKWNDVSLSARILPNRTVNARLNGNSTTEVYYALYEKVTPNLQYKRIRKNKNGTENVLSDDVAVSYYEDTFKVTGLVITNVNSLYIPFARYYQGYMLPISKIDCQFGISNTLSEIAIGGAVSEIGNQAFKNVKANKINFYHKGPDIWYNYAQSVIPTNQLIIGNEAFANNTVLTELKLPLATKTLGDGAFQSCINLHLVSFEVFDKFNAENNVSSLTKLGNFVFKGDINLSTADAIISLLENDGANGIVRFANNDVGNGIFMKTNVRSTKGRNYITWRNTLLHAYYSAGDSVTFTVSQDTVAVAGYAFVDLGSDVNSSLLISIQFDGSNTKIKANAFTDLHRSVGHIYLNRTQNGIEIDRIKNVDTQAFDLSASRDVTVHTNSAGEWRQQYVEIYGNNNSNFKFTFAR